jgi:hypothetical protein
MADPVQDVIATDYSLGFGQQRSQSNYICLKFITNTIDDADTYTLGSEGVVIDAAWEGDGVTDDGTVTFATNVVTFHMANAASSGYLHLWFR